MALEGISQALGERLIVEFHPLKFESHAAEALAPVSPEQFGRFVSRFKDPVPYPVDQRDLHVVHAMHNALTAHEEYAAILYGIDSLGDLQPQVAALHGRLQRQAVLDPRLVQWHPDGENLKWWHWSDETYHAHHFWDPAPKDVYLVVGGFQAYNLPNDQTRMVIRLDYDGRQVMHDTIFGGLILTSNDPAELVENFRRLVDPETQRETTARIMKVMAAAEAAGSLPAGRTQFLYDLQSRTGALSLLALETAYASAFDKIAQGSPLSPSEANNLEWLLDPHQFRVVQDLYRQGRMVMFQVNVCDPASMEPVIRSLEASGRQVSTFYLSDPLDLVGQRGYEGMTRPLRALGETLRRLPSHEAARLQWTQLQGIRQVEWVRGQ